MVEVVVEIPRVNVCREGMYEVSNRGRWKLHSSPGLIMPSLGSCGTRVSRSLRRPGRH